MTKISLPFGLPSRTQPMPAHRNRLPSHSTRCGRFALLQNASRAKSEQRIVLRGFVGFALLM